MKLKSQKCRLKHGLLTLVIGLSFSNVNAQNFKTGLNFDGTNDQVQTTFSGVSGTTNRTFEAWIYINSTAPTNNTHCILDYGANVSGKRNTFIVNNADMSLRFVSGGTNGNISGAANGIVADTWTHVAFVLDAGTGYLYVNGVQTGTGNLSGVNSNSTTTNVRLGNRVPGGNTRFNGSMDDVRIWNVAKSATDILASMNKELACPYPANLVANYKLNDGVAGGTYAGTTIKDEINLSATNTLNNFALTGSTSNFISTSVDSQPTWIGITSTDWNTASNWNPAVVPTINDSVVILGNTLYNPTAASYTIDATKAMCLTNDAQLTISTGALTNNGVVLMQNGATLVQGATSTVGGTGTWNVEQTVAGGNTTSSDVGRFYYMGSPLTASTSLAFDAAGTNRAWSHDETLNSGSAFSEITDNSTVLTPGKGYGTIFAANETRTFTGGTPNNGAMTLSSLTKTGAGTHAGFNMVSNPYPSYLDWVAVTKTNIDPTVWFQTKTAGGVKVFDLYNATSGLATNNSGGITNQYIAPTQGFWVLSTGTGSLGLDNSMRSHQTAGSGLKAVAADFPAFVRLKLIDGDNSDETLVFFHENAQNEKDAFDSQKMFVNGASQVYSQVDEAQLALNGLHFVAGTTRSVPLTINFIGDNAFSLNATELHMANGMVFLEDKLNQTMHNLSNNDTYTFNAVAGTVANRFVLHFQDNGGLSIAEATKDAIAISADLTGNVRVTLSKDLGVNGSITILDAAGRVVSTKAITNATSQFQLTEKSGMYFVRVTSGNAVLTQKIIIAK